jgi:hypothetical protein
MTDDLDNMILGLVERIKLLESKLEEKQADSIKVQNQLQHANAKIAQLRERIQKDKDATYEAEVLKSKVEELEGINKKLHAEMTHLRNTFEQSRSVQFVTLSESEKWQQEQQVLQERLQSVQKNLVEKDHNLKQRELRIMELEAIVAASSGSGSENAPEMEQVVSDYRRINADLQCRVEELEEVIQLQDCSKKEYFQIANEEIQTQIPFQNDQMNDESISRERENAFESGKPSRNQLVSKLVDLAKDKAQFEWKSTFLRVQINYMRKERLQQRLGFLNIQDRNTLEMRKLRKQIESLEGRNQELVQLLSESRYGSSVPKDYLAFISTLESRLDIALAEIEQLRTFEANMYHEMAKKNIEIANLATRVHDLEQLRQMEYMEYQNLQDELFYCKQNYQQDYNSSYKKGSVSVSGHNEREEPSTHVESSKEQTILENPKLPNSLEMCSDPRGNFLPCQMLLQRIRAVLSDCRAIVRDEQLIQGFKNIEEYLAQVELMVSSMYRNSWAASMDMASLLMEGNRVFCESLMHNAIQEVGPEIILPFSDFKSKQLKSILSKNLAIVNGGEDTFSFTVQDSIDRALLAESELRILQSRYRKTVLETEPLRTELETVKLQLERANERQKDSQNQSDVERKEFASELQRRETKEQNLSSNLLNVTKSLDSATSQIQELNDQLNHLSTINSSYLQKIIDLEQKNASQEADRRVLETKLNTLIEEKNDQARISVSMQNEIERLKAMIAERETLVEELDGQLKILQKLSTKQASSQGLMDVVEGLSEKSIQVTVLPSDLASTKLDHPTVSHLDNHQQILEQYRKIEKEKEYYQSELAAKSLELENAKVDFSHTLSLLELEMSRLAKLTDNSISSIRNENDSYESKSLYDDVKYGLLDQTCESTVSVRKSAYHFYHGGFAFTIICMTVM